MKQSLAPIFTGTGNIEVGSGVALEVGVVCDLGTSGAGSITIGSRSKIKCFSVIRAYSGIVRIGHRVSIGEHCLVAGHGGITIEDHAILGSHCSLTSSEHLFSSSCEIRYQGEMVNPVSVGRGAWLGAGVRVMAGVSIGEGSVIGAGSVVTHNVPPFVVAYGVPCRVVGSVNEYSMKGFDFGESVC